MKMATVTLCSASQNPIKPLPFSSLSNPSPPFTRPNSTSFQRLSLSTSRVSLNNHGTSKRFNPFPCKCVSTISSNTSNYEFQDGSSEVELRLHLGDGDLPSTQDVFVDANDKSLLIRVKQSGSLNTLMETNQMFDRIKSGETIWYLDEDQLVISMKKQDPELKWPDIMESWESLTTGSMQLLKGTSIYIVGDSTEINQKVAEELAVGLGYTPLNTKELLESIAKTTIDSWVLAEGSDSVAETEAAIVENLSSHVRTVVATLGGPQGAAARDDKWQHLYAGFTVWLSQTQAIDEYSAKAEARKHVEEGAVGYSNADVVVKLQGWDTDHAKSVGQAALSALKQLILSDKKLPGKKSLYIRLGCRGDWPNIMPPGWDPSSGGAPPGTF